MLPSALPHSPRETGDKKAPSVQKGFPRQTKRTDASKRAEYTVGMADRMGMADARKREQKTERERSHSPSHTAKRQGVEGLAMQQESVVRVRP